jgi:cysteine desulfurase
MIYLDNNASTTLDPEVWAAMASAAGVFGNPSSVHAEGQKARRAVEEARGRVSSLIGAHPDEVFFTSGGSESNAMAIFGALAERPGRLVISGAEHPSVREPALRAGAGARGRIATIDPDPSGVLDPERVLEAAVPGTTLISVMAANNEYGGIFPIAAIAEGARRRGALFHTDAVQAVGKIPVDAAVWGVDLLSLSAHKFHGPKGAGALFVRRGVRLSPHTPGGGQEKRLRAGTENTLAIVGFGVAARLAAARREADSARVATLRDRLEQGILARIPESRTVGSSAPRLPNTSAILFEGASGEALLIRLDLEDIAVSVGSACSSGTLEPSLALRSLNLTVREAKSVVRFSLSRWTREDEVERVLECLPGIVREARGAASPVVAREDA